MSGERLGLVDDPAELAELIRREFGGDLPAAPVRESHTDREARQEKTRWVLETEVMARVNEARVRASNPVLSVAEEDRIVELVLSALFLLPHLLGILEREPLAEDLVVFGNDEARVDRADGTSGLYPPLVSQDAALERVIGQVAQDHHRPFSFESPRVDVQLSPRLRFHGQGFDIVSRPAIFIRVHRALGATLDDLFESGAISAGIRYLLGTVVPTARLSVALVGVQGSGKTSDLRAIALAYPPDTRMLTIETDFELGLRGLGRRWVQEMQARLPVTSKDRGISCADLVAPGLRTRAEVMIIGEVRGDEGAAAVRAASVGQGTLVTVHGRSAVAGLEQLVDRVAEDGTPREIARRMVYQSFDLVVHCTMAPDRTRWIGEIVHPLLEGDQPKLHTLYTAAASASLDRRARATRAPWPSQLLAAITAGCPEFDHSRALDDEYRPLGRIGVPDPHRNGAEVAV